MCGAGETLSGNRLNGCFQSRLCSLYNLCQNDTRWAHSVQEIAATEMVDKMLC